MKKMKMKMVKIVLNLIFEGSIDIYLLKVIIAKKLSSKHFPVQTQQYKHQKKGLKYFQSYCRSGIFAFNSRHI